MPRSLYYLFAPALKRFCKMKTVLKNESGSTVSVVCRIRYYRPDVLYHSRSLRVSYEFGTHFNYTDK